MVCVYCVRKKYISISKKYKRYTWFVYTVSEKNVFQDPKSIKDIVRIGIKYGSMFLLGCIRPTNSRCVLLLFLENRYV